MEMNLENEKSRKLLKEFLTFVGDRLEIRSLEILEKDFYLTIFLLGMKNDDLVFKGGTCLAKAYLGYYRFSEDLDFTWKNQEIFKDMGTGQIRKACSELINEIGNKIKEMCKKYGFGFEFEKGDMNYVEIRGGSKIVTFKIWYNSVLTEMKSFFKIQINFLEGIVFPIGKKKLKNLIAINIFSEEERRYFKELLEFYKMSPVYNVYGIKEMACEKIRAILTRRGVKTRDVLDLYLIKKNFKIDFEKLNSICKEKIIFSLKLYNKYRENFNNITKHPIMKEILLGENIEHLLLIKIDEKNFDTFLNNFSLFLNALITQIKSDLK